MKHTKSSSILDILEDKGESPNTSDVLREEELWTTESEKFLIEWMTAMCVKSKAHDKSYKKFKKYNNVLALPTILLPLILSPLTGYITDFPIISSLMLISTGVLSGINSFFNFSKKSQQNNEYSNLYAQLAREIKIEVRRPSRFRMPVDKFSERIYQKYSALDASSPT